MGKPAPRPEWHRWPPAKKRALLRELAARRYWRDPAGWVERYVEFPEGRGPAPHQLDGLRLMIERGRAATHGPHGMGKTSSGAWAVWWFYCTREALGTPWKAPTTASVGRQLAEYLWPEIHLWHGRIRWHLLGMDPPRHGRELLDMHLVGQHGSAFAVTSSDPAAIEGAHAPQILYLFDESKTIGAAIFDAAEGAFATAGEDTGQEAYGLAYSTPGEPSGRFYEICSRKAGYRDLWAVRAVTDDEAISAGLMSAEWRANMAAQWGKDSAVYQRRVEGKFAASEGDAVIPLAWIEEANERWRGWQRRLALGQVLAEGEWVLSDPEALPPFTCVAADIADGGSDSTVFAIRHGNLILPLERPMFGKVDDEGEAGQTSTMQTAGRLRAIIRGKGDIGYVVCDAIGVGAGVFGSLREQRREAGQNVRWSVHGFVGSTSSRRLDRNGEYGFTNTRSEAWWNLREMLDPSFGSELALPPDEAMIGDLAAPRWWEHSGGKIQVEPKEKLIERIGHSPDSADAVVMGCWPPTGAGPARTASAATLTLPRIMPRRV